MKTCLKYIIGAGLGGIFLWLAFRGVDLKRVRHILFQVDYNWVIVAGFAMLSSHVVRAWRWGLLLFPVKKDIPLRFTFSSTMIGYLINTILPRAGELAKAVSLTRMSRVSLSSIVASVLVERVIDTITLLLLLAFSMLFYREEIRKSFPMLEGISYLLLAISIGLIIFFYILTRYSEKVFYWVNRIIGKRFPNLTQKILEQLKNFLDGFEIIRTPGKYLIIVISSFLIFFLYIMSTYLMLLSFAFSKEYHIGIMSAMAITVIGGLGYVVPSPGGTGSFHYFCSRALIWIFFVPKTMATSFATLLWVLNTFLIVIGGLFFLLIDRNKKEQPAPSSLSCK